MVTGIEQLRKYQQREGLTQEQLARRIGVSGPLIGYWLQGKRHPSVKSIEAIARATEGEIPASVWFASQAVSPSTRRRRCPRT